MKLKNIDFGELFTRNGTIKAISFVLTVTLFVWVRADQESTVTANVPLRLVLPSGTMIMGGNAPEVVRVTVRGRDSDLSRFNRNQLDPIIIELNVLDHERPVGIPFDSIQTPSGVRVTNIVPSEIVVQIDNESTKMVTIVPRIIGSPKEPFHLGRVKVKPLKIKVTGPKTLLAGLNEIETEAIDVSGQSDSLRREVHLKTIDPLVTYEPNTIVNVNIPIDAQFGKRTIPGLAIVEMNANRPVVISPDTMEIELKGPSVLLDKVSPDTIHVVVDLSGIKLLDSLQTLTPSVRNIPKGISLVKMTPTSVEVSALNVEEGLE